MDRLLCFMDLNGFKKVNENFSREVGNKVLEHFGRTLASAIEGKRGKDMWLVRYTADEYILLLERKKTFSDSELVKFFKNLHRTLCDNPYKLPDGKDYILSAACGIVRKSEFSELMVAIDRADQAMYVSKRLMKKLLVNNENNEPSEMNPPAGIVATLSWNENSKKLIRFFNEQNISEKNDEMVKLYEYAKAMSNCFPNGYFIANSVVSKYESATC